jgi:hypothetical protein
MRASPPPTRSAAAIARAVIDLARFRAEGLDRLDASPRGLLRALTPWLAFALVRAALSMVSDGAYQALSGLLFTVVGTLAPLVISHALARAWGREAAWLRYAVGFTWCQWVMPLALLAALWAGGLLTRAGLSQDGALVVSFAALLAYALTLQGFVARHALAVSRGRAALVVIAVNVGTALLAIGPSLLSAEPDGVP